MEYCPQNMGTGCSQPRQTVRLYFDQQSICPGFPQPKPSTTYYMPVTGDVDDRVHVLFLVAASEKWS